MKHDTPSRHSVRLPHVHRRDQCPSWVMALAIAGWSIGVLLAAAVVLLAMGCSSSMPPSLICDANEGCPLPTTRPYEGRFSGHLLGLLDEEEYQ